MNYSLACSWPVSLVATILNVTVDQTDFNGGLLEKSCCWLTSLTHLLIQTLLTSLQLTLLSVSATSSLPACLSLFISSSTPAGLVVSWVQLPSGPMDGWAYGCSDAPCCASTQPSFFFVSLLDHLSPSPFSLFNPTVGFSGTTDSTLGQELCFLFLFEHSSNRGVMQCTHTHTHTWDTDKQYRHTL